MSRIIAMLVALCGAGLTLAAPPATRPMLQEALRLGVNFSSLQGTPDNLPGHLNGEVFVTPEPHFAYYAAKGLTHIRLEGSWERLQPRLNGPLGEQLLDHYADEKNPLRNPVNLVRHYLDLAEKHRLRVVLDLCHNYGFRYVGYDGSWKTKRKSQLGSADLPIDAFVDYQVKLVQEFSKHPAVIAIELMNEPHDLEIGPGGWMDACQTSIDAIRAIDRSIIIFIDGYGWSNAEFWAERNPNLHQLRDPSDRLVFTAHQYFDHDSQGLYRGDEATKPRHANVNIGAQRIAPFIAWLKRHNFEGRGSLGEFGAPDTPEWTEIVHRTIAAAMSAGLMLTAHEDVPYPNDPYVMNLFPREGEADRQVIRLMQEAARKQ